MKSGTHPSKALSAVKVRSELAAGRYADGNGLYLVVDPSGARRWVLRTVAGGKRRDIGLGSAKLVPLADAREQAAALRKLARDGGDPLAERRQARVVVPTFAEAAQRVYDEHKAAWKNAKHTAQWLSSLQRYAFPSLKNRRVDEIDTPEVLRVLSVIWLKKPETARRVRQRIGTVMDWAKASGFRTGDNPIDGVSKGLPKQTGRDGHFAAMPYANVPGFVRDLRAAEAVESIRLAFEFLILTATRTNEVIGARWSEIDLMSKVWTIPAERMKARREHRVPLAERALELLQRAKPVAGDSDFVFPGRSGARPMSNMALLMLLRRMKVEATVHGFRSSFRDWAAERTNFPREVCELALAHMIKDKSEAAYRRGDLLDKRRELAEAWARFVTTIGGNVVAIRASGRPKA